MSGVLRPANQPSRLGTAACTSRWHTLRLTRFCWGLVRVFVPGPGVLRGAWFWTCGALWASGAVKPGRGRG